MKIKFFKYEGTGNDFIILDKITEPQLAANFKDLAVNICDRHYGIGADGLVVVSKDQGRFAWDFYNSDGSYASMCGNAARCVALHLYKHHGAESGTIVTGAGEIAFKKLEEVFSVEMPAYKDYQQVDERAVFVNTGVPHFVIQLDPDKDTLSYIQKYRWHKVAGDHGANVTFYYQKDGSYYAKTFERGVEGFTLACGTGAAACGLVVAKTENLESVPVIMPGGDLRVVIEGTNIFLHAKANAICHGDYYV